ncbi:uncharacterized protein METZ01_LOCUS486936, partial [marine metagenome]
CWVSTKTPSPPTRRPCSGRHCRNAKSFS